MESDIRIKRDVVVEDRLPQVGNEVAGHRQKEDSVDEHHRRASSTRDGETMTHDFSQTNVLSFNSVGVGPLYEDTDCDELKHNKIEDVKSVVFHPSFEDCEFSFKIILRQRPCLNWYVKDRARFG